MNIKTTFLHYSSPNQTATNAIIFISKRELGAGTVLRSRRLGAASLIQYLNMELCKPTTFFIISIYLLSFCLVKKCIFGIFIVEYMHCIFKAIFCFIKKYKEIEFKKYCIMYKNIFICTYRKEASMNIVCIKWGPA